VSFGVSFQRGVCRFDEFCLAPAFGMDEFKDFRRFVVAEAAIELDVGFVNVPLFDGGAGGGAAFFGGHSLQLLRKMMGGKSGEGDIFPAFHQFALYINEVTFFCPSGFFVDSFSGFQIGFQSFERF
jgi:hypothetical protein